MQLLIDAINIRAGGGLTHLQEILSEENYTDNSFEKIHLVTLLDLSGKIQNKKIYIHKLSFTKFERALYLFYPYKILRRYLNLAEINLIFSPGGTFYSKKKGYISMSQNMLVFEKAERKRFPLSVNRIRYNLLEVLQKRSLINAKGNIFISDYAFSFISKKYPIIKKIPHRIIYHGVSQRFRNYPKKQKTINEISKKNPFKILYVSVINYYKHQDKVIEAVKILNKKNIPVHLHLVGPINPSIKKQFAEAMNGAEAFVTYHGSIAYNQIHKFYKEADLFVFASTCENMPNILIEAMSAGLPVLSSSFGPMPEILKESGIYCNPLYAADIAGKLERMLRDEELRNTLSFKAFAASVFEWRESSRETFDFLYQIALENAVKA